MQAKHYKHKYLEADSELRDLRDQNSALTKIVAQMSIATSQHPFPISQSYGNQSMQQTFTSFDSKQLAAVSHADLPTSKETLN